MRPIAYLQLTDLDAFVKELERRRIREARLTEWVQRPPEVFERRKLRLTAIDEVDGFILRFDTMFYDGFIILPDDENQLTLLSQAREEAEHRIKTKLAKAEIKLMNGEYHTGTAKW